MVLFPNAASETRLLGVNFGAVERGWNGDRLLLLREIPLAEEYGQKFACQLPRFSVAQIHSLESVFGG